jgi:hypothetical protein
MKSYFPVFVIAKDVDPKFLSAGILDLPDSTKFSAAMLSIDRKLEAYLSWFTSLKAAKNYMTRSSISGVVVSICDAPEATSFLSRQNGRFFGVCLNPDGIYSQKPVTYRCGDFVDLFRELATLPG